MVDRVVSHINFVPPTVGKETLNCTQLFCICRLVRVPSSWPIRIHTRSTHVAISCMRYPLPFGPMSWYGRFDPSVMCSSAETSSQVPIICARTLPTLSWSPRAVTRKQTVVKTKPTIRAEAGRIIFAPLVLKPGHTPPGTALAQRPANVPGRSGCRRSWTETASLQTVRNHRHAVRQFRRLLVRHEHLLTIHPPFFYLGCLWITSTECS